MRKTKIVCTIGPASETEQIITGLCKAGMNVASTIRQSIRKNKAPL